MGKQRSGRRRNTRKHKWLDDINKGTSTKGMWSQLTRRKRGSKLKGVS